MVVFTRSAIDDPASSKMAARLTNACSVCASTPSRTAPVSGSIPTVPEQNTKPPATMAWLYGPSAAGARSVEMPRRSTSPPALPAHPTIAPASPHRLAHGEGLDVRSGERVAAAAPVTALDFLDHDPGDRSHVLAFDLHHGVGEPANDVVLLLGGEDSFDDLDVE